LFGDDLKTLEDLAEHLEANMKRIPGLVDLVVPQHGNPEFEVRIDPTRAAKASLTVQEVSKRRAAGLLGEVATEVLRGDRRIDLRVRYPDAYRFDLGWVREYPLVATDGTTVPVSALADVEPGEGAASLYREDLKHRIRIAGRLAGRDMGSVVRDVQKMLRSMRFPVGFTYAIGGQYE